MTDWTRRGVVRSLSLAGAGLALGACARRPGAAQPAVASDPVRIGWRWSPGMQRTWRTTIARVHGPWTTRTTEAWSYLATDISVSGDVLLEGTLRGLGGEVLRDGVPAGPERRAQVRKPTSPGPISMSMRLNGRIDQCSVEGFAAALPHLLLGLHLPTHQVTVGESWEDHALSRAFVESLPLDTERRTRSHTTLRALDRRGAPPTASLDHLATLRPQALGPGLEVRGQSTWDLAAGALRQRSLEARFVQIEGPVLTLDVALIA